jgi:hypothetical protein
MSGITACISKDKELDLTLSGFLGNYLTSIDIESLRD